MLRGNLFEVRMVFGHVRYKGDLLFFIVELVSSRLVLLDLAGEVAHVGFGAIGPLVLTLDPPGCGDVSK